jgi:hypothetical protein
MISNRRLLLVPFLLLTAWLSLACITEGAVLTPPTPAPEDDASVQAECSDILGRAFVSAEQRQWFIENCSRWPQLDVPQTPARQFEDTPECAAIRGRPYESQQQRQWFLNNCLGNGQQNNQATTGDRSNCDEIRGTPYRSDTERTWYLGNCLGQQWLGGPDRNNCDEIRGTPYRSPAERQFFLANCLGTVSPQPPQSRTDPQPIVVPLPSRGSSDDERRGPGRGRGPFGGRGNEDD